MALSEEQIKSILIKDIKCKTILVSKEEKEKIINEHQIDGWKLIKEIEINEKIKITFEKIK